MKLGLRILFGLIFLIFAIIQLIRPSFTNPQTDASLKLENQISVPSEVNSILERSCKDCHSNETVYPWYSNIQPVGWYLANHVEEGRHELNFSEWGTYSQKKRKHKLEEICEQVKIGEMPLRSYLLIHREAVLSEEDKRILCDWTDNEISKLPSEE
ncbi:MAG: heme-binding domain-containing protein [Pyrinomonadaceae bacterium]|nr:heme-binding domain-containing protein [Pyrinomonadaceae bacterium]MCX7638882.1 heme-binding domain-containing protein [Pyrinomonadaceae bacterium]MDW8304981.1 heme-binding domain-containing protein [Acidobacteriota bacterium]